MKYIYQTLGLSNANVVKPLIPVKNLLFKWKHYCLCESAYNGTFHSHKFMSEHLLLLHVSKHETWRSRLALRDIAFEKKKREKRLSSYICDALFMIIWCTYYFYLKQITVKWTQNQNPFRKMLESQMLTIAAILHNWLVKAKIILDKLLILFKLKLKQLELSTTLCFSCKI